MEDINNFEQNNRRNGYFQYLNLTPNQKITNDTESIP